MLDVGKHSQAALYPSEVVTLALLFALKGVGNRAFYRWLKRDCRHLFPHLPERTRLFRLFNSHRVWTYFKSRVGYTMALFNLLVHWHGLQPDDDGFVRLSIAEFSL